MPRPLNYTNTVGTGRVMAWLEDHPMVARIKSNGSNACQQSAAVQVYFDLTEVKQWNDVQVHFNQNLKMCYLITHQSLTSSVTPAVAFQVTVPLPTSTPITMQLIDQLFLCIPEPFPATHGGVPNAKLTLGLVDSEGVITYYHLYKGIHSA